MNNQNRARTFRLLTHASLVGWLLSGVSTARADTIQPATYSEIADTLGAIVGGPAGGRLEIHNASSGTILFNPQCDPITNVCANSYARTAGIPEATVQGAIAGGEFSSVSDAVVTYYFEITSPNNIQTTVPMLFTGSLVASASGSWAQGQATFTTNAGIPFASQVTTQNVVTTSGFASVCAGSNNSGQCATGGGVNGVEFSNLPFSASSGSQYYLELTATGTANPSNGTPGSYTALADPEVSIDPTWLASHPGYSVEFSSS